MNLRETLLQEKRYSKDSANRVTAYAIASPQHFKALMQCFTDKDYRTAQRAARSVSDAVAKQPDLIKPYIKNIVAQLLRTGVHDAVIRNSLRIVERIAIPEAFHGELMNACFLLFEKPGTAVAIKAFALTTLYNLSGQYPEIKNELVTIIEERMNKETAAFKSRGKRIVQQLQKGKSPGV